ncbi:unnamed protein product [Cyprideis torosa]|uniref:Uncharacterized protein n=1 Tax=Cyprideis torosa TaxID=163714 RepID=A0A7R8WA01_9CRUS|nr:unnamed protein product [Cyprideis torosa]CAG0884849.1 unnamed protein product [Cyprideis torosa]
MSMVLVAVSSNQTHPHPQSLGGVDILLTDFEPRPSSLPEKSAEEASTREAATRRLEQYYEDASKEKERWRGEFMDLFNRILPPTVALLSTQAFLHKMSSRAWAVTLNGGSPESIIRVINAPFSVNTAYRKARCELLIASALLNVCATPVSAHNFRSLTVQWSHHHHHTDTAYLCDEHRVIEAEISHLEGDQSRQGRGEEHSCACEFHAQFLKSEAWGLSSPPSPVAKGHIRRIFHNMKEVSPHEERRHLLTESVRPVKIRILIRPVRAAPIPVIVSFALRVKSLEAQWRSCSELQAVIRHGIQHLAVCMKTNCKHCIVVQEATSPMHLSSPGATATLQTRKQQARWLRLQFQELTSAFSTLLPDCPHRLLWEGSPGVSYSSDESNGGNEDSGFEDKDDESRRSFVRQVWQRRSHPVGNGAGGSSLYRPAATHEHHRSYVAVAGPSDETSARRKAGGALWRMLQRISMRKKPLPPSPVAGE